MPTTVGERLAALSERAGLRGDVLARACGFSGRSAIQRYLAPHHTTPLRMDTAEKFIKGLVGRGSPPITRHDVLLAIGLSAVAEIGTADAPEKGSSGPVIVEMPVTWPSEASLTHMFRQLLADLPDGLGQDELAQALARRLPTALLPYARRDAGLPAGGGMGVRPETDRTPE